jgi:ribosome recycling factor
VFVRAAAQVREAKPRDWERTKMAAGNFDVREIEKRMKGAVSALKQEFGGLRTGRASVTLLDPLMVNTSYGAKMPINQVASVNTPEPRLITVQVWDRSNLSAVEKAIRESDLGLNPVVDGLTLRLPIPELNQERRQELVKIARKYTEQGRVAVRNVRKDGMDQIKKLEKDGKIGEDESVSLSAKVQDLTDRTVKELDGLLEGKEHEIMQV